MRVLIIGAGIAGLTLAAKLLQQGRKPVVIERDSEFRDKGYAFCTYPLGTCVLHGLGAYDELIKQGEIAKSYQIVDGAGQLLQEIPLSAFAGDIGPMVMITRAAMTDILRGVAADAEFRMGTTATQIHQPDDRSVDVVFSDGKSESFDIVLGCDGIHSHTRSMVFKSKPDVFDTEWVLWTWWADMPEWPRDTLLESLAAGRYFGLFPTAGRVMCCAGMHKGHLSVKPTDLPRAKPKLLALFDDLVKADPQIGPAIESAERFFVWSMTDARSKEWAKGRVGLCGDAAVGFLPTAGAGANSAMRAAASLADEISRVDGKIAPLALELFEKRCRQIFEKNQGDSRTMARYTFMENATLAWGRNEVLKYYPAMRIVSDIVDAMHTPF